MYTIKKQFDFCASHVLACLAPEHPCSRMHGHNYVVIVELESEELNEAGFVRDYRELDKIKKYIDSYLDHRHLNDVWPDMNPSAENIAKRLCKLFRYDMGLKEVFAVTVKETPKTEARYELDFD